MSFYKNENCPKFAYRTCATHANLAILVLTAGDRGGAIFPLNVGFIDQYLYNQHYLFY